MLKKSTALFLVFLMVLMSASSVFQAVATVNGDVNSDGRVNSTDYLLVKRHVLGTKTLTTAQQSNADVDNDGDIDSIDYIMVKRMALGTLESAINTANKTAISYSKSYTTSVSANSTYPDTYGEELTDGHVSLAADYSSDAFSGFSSDVNIVIDLGSDGKDICGFELSYLNTNAAGIYSPKSLTVYGGNSSSLNGSWTELGTKNIVYVNNTSVRSVTIDLNSTVDYSYIRFEVKISSAGAWQFIDEAIVYGIVDTGEDIVTDPYKADTKTDAQRLSELNSVKSGTYNSSKGNTVISGGCSYSIACSEYDSRCGSNSRYLTDGSQTGSYFSSNAWIGIGLKGSSSITMTLGYNTYSDVCGFALHCFNRPTATINLPPYVDISVSTNGRDYYTVGRVYAPDTKQENFAYRLFLDTLVSARYVRFSFPAGTGYMWVEEAEVYANRSAVTTSNSVSGYLAPSDNILGGVEDVLLVYHNTGVVNEAMLTPYVAYVDENGNILDTMYDGYLFLPGVGEIYTTGSTPWGTNKAEDWLWLFDELFKKNRNLEALEKTAEKVKLLLGKSELKLKVYLTIPHMDSTLSDFGDIDGDGDSENLTSQANRVYVAKYYAQMLTEEFESRNYENLELCGFYWFHEAIAGSDIYTAQAVNQAFDQIGAQLFWIPYFRADGYLNGYDYGFDAVCLQPNYAFSLDVLKSRLQVAADYARQKGMCLEIEIAPEADVDVRYFQKYMDYLSCGVQYGYMNNAIHMYYQGFDDIGSTWNSESARTRLIYKYTYQFIKGTLDVTPSTVSALSFNAKQNTRMGGTINTNNSDAQIYRVSGSPSHGSIAFAENGSFVYYPNKGYTGTDTFTYQISNYLGWSEECTVTIKVS